MPDPHGKDLRKGRVSEVGRSYLITTVTQERECCFTDLSLGRIVVDSLRWCDDHGLAQTWCYVVMPDHLHWLFALGGGVSLSQLVGNVKRITALRINRRRAQTGTLWQKGFHDHALRREENLREVARYVVMNPVRAGLVRTIRDYPLWDASWLPSPTP